MIRYNIFPSDFTATYKNIAKNSLMFENACRSESMATTSKDTSRLDIRSWDCDLLTTYLPSIIENAHTMNFLSVDEARKYYMNPQRLSKDISGITDYWYLILAMNDYTSRFDFKDFTGIILIPDATYVNSLITKIENELRTVIYN